ncbi:hypothetical protein ACFL6Q_06595 [Candidatus Neomarinimicrobiota bacterium]
MNRNLLSRRSKGWITALVTSFGLLFLVNQCEQNPIIASLPGSEWQLHTDLVQTMKDSVLYRTPVHGTSQTLYAGSTDDGQRESGILIKFAKIDTAVLPQFKYARLLLFRRPFSDVEPVPSSQFSLSIIESDTVIWSESDTGLTVEDITDVRLYGTAPVQISPATTFPEGIATEGNVEHLAFDLDSLLLRQWATGALANNGFLIQGEDAGEMVGFYARGNVEYSPYIALGLHDTSTSQEPDTNIVRYHGPIQDLSIYPTLTAIAGMAANDIADGMIHLDHSNGLIGHLDFSDSFDPETNSMVAGAQLVLHTNEAQQPLQANAIELLVARHAESLVEGDSSIILLNDILYTTGDDSLVLSLGGYLTGLVAGSLHNYGLRISVLPRRHDFDHLVLWGSQAPVGLRPRLEVTYATPFHEEIPDE